MAIMTANRRTTGGLIVALLALSLHGAALAEVTLRLSGIPERLTFPLAGGTNRILTVTVGGGKAKAVWLARDGADKVRVMLDAVGDGQYQVNLADPAVSAILSATGSGGQFRAFAETEDGEIVESIPVRYSVRSIYLARLRVTVYADGRAREVSPEPRGTGYLYSDRATGPWFRPETVERLEVQFDASVPVPSAEARVGYRRWRFSVSGAANVLTLELTPDMARAWRKRGKLTVHFAQAGQDRALVTLKAPPDRLELPEDSATVTVVQRYSRELPGSGGYLRLGIGDITAGQVLLTLRTADGRALIGQTSVRKGDDLTFPLGEETYTLSVKALVNLLMGDDYGVFVVSRTVPPEVKKIRDLIALLEASDVVLIRNNQEYSPAEAADHLQSKLEHAKAEVRTLDDFIEKVASRSWLSGKPYLIRLPGGRTVEAEAWFRERSAELAPEPETED